MLFQIPADDIVSSLSIGVKMASKMLQNKHSIDFQNKTVACPESRTEILTVLLSIGHALSNSGG